MAQGLQIFNSDGSLQMDITDRLTRLSGSIYLPALGAWTTGSAPVPGLGSLSTNGWFTMTSTGVGFLLMPIIDMPGGQITWSTPGFASSPCWLHFGNY